MKTFLTYNNLTRWESEQSIIDNLVRKGWIINNPPDFNSETQYPPQWIDGAWIVNQKEILNRRIWPTAGHFWLTFTETEQEAIASSNIPAIQRLVVSLTIWPGEVWSDDPRVQQGLQGLTLAGILSVQRANEILAPTGLL